MMLLIVSVSNSQGSNLGCLGTSASNSASNSALSTIQGDLGESG